MLFRSCCSCCSPSCFVLVARHTVVRRQRKNSGLESFPCSSPARGLSGISLTSSSIHRRIHAVRTSPWSLLEPPMRPNRTPLWAPIAAYDLDITGTPNAAYDLATSGILFVAYDFGHSWSHQCGGWFGHLWDPIAAYDLTTSGTLLRRTIWPLLGVRFGHWGP